MLTLKNINLSLDAKTEHKILNNLDFCIKKGEFIVVIGKNGAGKSSMLDIISGFLKPTSGKVIINDQDITTMSQICRASFISKVAQDPKLGTIENMSIYENMALALKRGQKRNLLPFSNKFREQLFKTRLEMLNMGLENKMDKLVGNLSGGQRQALSLIMAVLTEPKILLLDEITSALDFKSSETIMEITAKIIQERKITCIMITHNMSHAAKYGDRLLILKNGAVNIEYSPSQKLQLSPLKLTTCFKKI